MPRVVPDPSNPRHIALARESPLGWGWFVSRGLYHPYRHIVFLNQAIVDAIGGIQDLLMEAHPRSGKSLLVSRFTPGWFLGTFPDLSVLHASWKVQMSEKWGRRVRRDIENYGRLVFGIQVSKESRSAARFGIEGREGQFLATGATGGVQGEPAHLLVTDDMVKGSEAVRSEVQFDHLAEFITEDLETRREEQPRPCVHISIETPWHERDPHGVLRETFPHRYRTIRLPALAESEGDPLGREVGEPLCPERVSLQRLYEIRRAKPHLWNALYQCRPTAQEGGVWKRRWWREPDRTYRIEDGAIRCFDGYSVPIENTIRFVTVDLAVTEKSSADFTAILACALTPETPKRLVLLDIDRRRMEGPEINPSVARMLAKWGARVAYMEQAGQQAMAIQYARIHGIPVRTIGRSKECDIQVSGDKVAVSHEATPLPAAGRLLVPAEAWWVADWEHEILTFPNAAYDDQVDATAWACHVAATFTRFTFLRPRVGDHSDREERKRAKSRGSPVRVRRGDALDEWTLPPP